MSLVVNILYILVLLSTCAADFHLTVLHTNDIHARVEQTDKYGGSCTREDSDNGKCYGGVARRKTAIDTERRNSDNVLLLDAGDEFQGTVWFNFYKGLEASHFMNLLQYDAMAFGNHEFDNGVAGVIPFLNNITFPVVCSNLQSMNEPRLQGLFKRSTVVDLGGSKVGIVGYLTTTAEFSVNPDGIQNLSFTNEINSIQKEVDELSNLSEGPVKIIIALGHAGIAMDKAIAAQVKGVDLVIGGHTNTFLYTGVPPSDDSSVEGRYPAVITQSSGRRVPVVQAKSYGKYLGKIQLVFDEDGELTSWSGNPIFLNSSIPEDPTVLEEVNLWAEPLDEFRDKVIGSTLVYMDGERSSCRMKECNMGNIVLDGIVYENLYTGNPSDEEWTKSAIAFWNGGGIRQSVNKGHIKRGTIVEVMPFANEVVRILIPGQAILEILEHSVSAYDVDGSDPPGGFLQMSGVRVAYNISQPVGQRVVSVQVLCTACPVPTFQPLDTAANYSVLTSQYLLSGGDAYAMFRSYLLDLEPLGYLGSDILEQFLRQRSPVTTGLDGRILFVGNTTDDLWTQPPQSCKTHGTCAPPTECPTCHSPDGCNTSNQGSINCVQWLWTAIVILYLVISDGKIGPTLYTS